MHLAYALEHPECPAEVQRAFKIAPEASFALLAKPRRQAVLPAWA